MNESPDDHGTVCEVLAAFVRDAAPSRAAIGPIGSERIAATGEQTTPRPAADVQAALTVLGRRPSGGGRAERNPIDLSDVQLQGADLRWARLRDAHLERTQLQGADLDGAELVGAYLIRAQLQGATLTSARLQGADLTHAQHPTAGISSRRR